MESKAGKTKDRIGWHWGEVGRDRGERSGGGGREKAHETGTH